MNSRNLLRRLSTAAAVALCLAFTALPPAQGSPVDLATPAGLNPGDKFRFAFLTPGIVSGTSGDIGFYNTFVTSQASGAKYEGAVVDWKALASTTTVDARDNIGGFGTSVPVYLVTGVKIADTMTSGTSGPPTSYGLWSGALYADLDLDINGNAVNWQANGGPYTGSHTDGTKYVGKTFAAGTGHLIMNGYPNFHLPGMPGWWIESGVGGVPTPTSLYAISAELTVPTALVPEIDPAGMAGVLALLGGGLGLIERRRRAGKTA